MQCPEGVAGIHRPSRWAKPSSATAQTPGHSVTRSPIIGQARIIAALSDALGKWVSLTGFVRKRKTGKKCQRIDGMGPFCPLGAGILQDGGMARLSTEWSRHDLWGIPDGLPVIRSVSECPPSKAPRKLLIRMANPSASNSRSNDTGIKGPRCDPCSWDRRVSCSDRAPVEKAFLEILFLRNSDRTLSILT